MATVAAKTDFRTSPGPVSKSDTFTLKTTSGQVRKSDDTLVEGPVETVSIHRIRPATVNGQIYRKIDRKDPATQRLAQRIKKFGFLGEIVVTSDSVIISGHRRYECCKMLNFWKVRIRRLNISSLDPRFLEILVSYNEQRVKGIDEIVKEAIVLADPKAARVRLHANRQRLANEADGRIEKNRLNVLAPKLSRKRSIITDAKRPMLDHAKLQLSLLKKNWPITLRQLHYRMLNDPPLRNANREDSTYTNDPQSYKDLSDLLSRAREAGEVEWESMHDPLREAMSWPASKEVSTFIRKSVNNFLCNYRRDMLQSQDDYFEVIGEKNTILTAVENATRDFGMPYCIGRGFSSVDMLRNLSVRFHESGKRRLVLLLLTDFDPEGECIAETVASNLRDKHGVENIHPIKVALNADHVRQFNIKPGLKAKALSSRRKGFVEKHGEHVYELEAIGPDQLEALIREAIVAVVNHDRFNAEVEAEERDSAELEAIREQFMKAMAPFIRTSPKVDGDDLVEDEGDSTDSANE